MPEGNHHSLLSILVLIIIIVVGVVFWVKDISKIRQFDGNLTTIDGDVVTIRGTFAGDNPNAIFTDRGPAQDIDVVVANDTVITQISVHIPNTTEMIIIDSLPQEEAVVDLSTLAQDASKAAIGITAKVKKSFFSRQYRVEEIVYHTPVFSVAR